MIAFPRAEGGTSRIIKTIVGCSQNRARAASAASACPRNNVVFTANGKVLSYGISTVPPDPNPSAVVAGGVWNAKATSDGKVDFKLIYFEKNLIPARALRSMRR